MNCLIENEYIKGTFQKNKSPMYSRMNCLIENDYIKGTFQKKNTYVFTNELPNWKRILKGKNRKKTGKNSWRTLLRGGFIILNRELAYFIVGGFINAMLTLVVIYLSTHLSTYLSTHLSTYYLSTYYLSNLPIYVSVSICQIIYPSYPVLSCPLLSYLPIYLSDLSLP